MAPATIVLHNDDQEGIWWMLAMTKRCRWRMAMLRKRWKWWSGLLKVKGRVWKGKCNVDTESFAVVPIGGAIVRPR